MNYDPRNLTLFPADEDSSALPSMRIAQGTWTMKLVLRVVHTCCVSRCYQSTRIQMR